MEIRNLEMITTSDELVEYAISEYESPLINYAATIVNDVERAKDVVQDTFIRLYKQDVEKVKVGLKSWLYTVCRNRALDILRKEQRMISTDDAIFSNEASDSTAPDQNALQQERVDKIMEYMERLSDNQRICIQLKFQSGLSYAEINKKTGLTSGNIGFLIHSGLKRLRELLPEKEHFLS